ncbi:hypothetical protein GBA52_011396 [Prunus armeniaca]|nr:hypothetical protein GBA52_011396 [Prunus armeniaca]
MQKRKCGNPKTHLSKFVVTCAFVWVCLMKAQDCSETGVASMEGDDGHHHFGNCLTPCYVAEEKREVMAEYAVVKFKRLKRYKVVGWV